MLITSSESPLFKCTKWLKLTGVPLLQQSAFPVIPCSKFGASVLWLIFDNQFIVELGRTMRMANIHMNCNNAKSDTRFVKYLLLCSSFLRREVKFQNENVAIFSNSQRHLKSPTS